MFNNFDDIESRNPRPDLPPPRMEWVEKVSEPVMSVLAKFVHGCSKDPNERTLAVTQLVATLCQLTGGGMTRQMPSVLVLNGHNQPEDPLDRLAGVLIPGPSEPVEGYYQHPMHPGLTVENAPKAMAQAIAMKADLGKVTPFNIDTHQNWVERYFVAQTAGFGSGPSRPYAKAWHETFELMTGRGGELILRIASPKDRVRFCKDVVGGARRLREPIGYGPDLKLGQKHIALSGSLPAWDWDACLATALIELGLPLLMLPSLAKASPHIANEAVLDVVAMCLPKTFTEPVEEPGNLPPTPWFDRYEGELRSRLRHLPGTYEYRMLKLARELLPVSLRIANWCGTYSGSGTEEISAMTRDLHQNSLRGLTLGVAGLAWHGLGIDTVVPRREFLRVLGCLRRNSRMTRSDLRRYGKISDSRTRDRLVERFEAEGLARVEGKVVTATSYVEFVEGLYAREGLPSPMNHWGRLGGEE